MLILASCSFRGMKPKNGSDSVLIVFSFIFLPECQNLQDKKQCVLKLPGGLLRSPVPHCA